MTTQVAEKRSSDWLLTIRAILVLILVLLSSPCGPLNAPVAAQETAPDVPPEASYDAGPQVWLEFPLEGQTLAMGPVTFAACATDADGVAQIDLRVNGEALPVVQLESLLGEGDDSIVLFDQEWQPPQEGQYIVEARARNMAGTYGEPSYVKFCVGSCEAAKATTPTNTPAPLIEATGTPRPAPTDTPWPMVSGTTTPTPTPAPSYDLYVRRMDYLPASPSAGDTIEMAIMLATDFAPQGAPYFPASHFRWRQGPNSPWQEETCPDNFQYASCVKNVTFSYPQAGSYDFEVQADSRQGVAEADETNNTKSWTIVVGEQQPPTPTFTPMPGYDLYVRRMDFMQTNPVVGDTIELSIMLATDIAPQGAPYFPASHFRWRQGPGFPWKEEVCSDDFHYASCLKSVTFSYAQPGSYAVEVQADSRGAIPETDETNNTRTWTIDVGQAQQEQPPPPQAEVYFWADPTTIYPGQCSVLYWEVANVQAVYLDGEGVEGSANRQVCPSETTVYTLRAVMPDGSHEDYPATVTVEGAIGSPDVPPEIPSTQDTTGPTISGMGLRWEGCSFYGYATIIDESGVNWAQFHFNDYDTSNEWRSLWMADKGGGYWETEYPVQVNATSGVVDYAVYADDTLSNHTESEMLGETFECGGSEIPQTLNF